MAVKHVSLLQRFRHRSGTTDEHQHPDSKLADAQDLRLQMIRRLLVFLVAMLYNLRGVSSTALLNPIRLYTSFILNCLCVFVVLRVATLLLCTELITLESFRIATNVGT